MKISVIQQDILWRDPAANRLKIERLLQAGSDLYLLPEMFPTGFDVSPQASLLDWECTLEWMKEQARNVDAALCGSAAVCEGGRLYNRAFFVCPDGSVSVYDKHHLFRSEAREFTPGSTRTVVQYKGMRFLLLTCYDLRFPRWCRNRKDYDCVLIGASWPQPRRYAWDTLLRARAIENQCYVAAANRVGQDPFCTYSGGTVILGPEGEVLSQAQDNLECIITSDIELGHLEQLRSSFGVLDDAD